MSDSSPLFTRAAETTILERLLREATEGDLVEYKTLSDAVHRDVRHQCRTHLRTARKTLEKEGIYFDADPGKGLVRLNDSGKVDGAHQRVRQAGRRIREGMSQLKSVDFANLTTDEKTRALTLGAQLQTVELFASSRATAKIEAAATKTTETLSIGETMSLFTK